MQLKNLKTLTLYGDMSLNASLFVRVTTRRAGNANDVPGAPYRASYRTRNAVQFDAEHKYVLDFTQPNVFQTAGLQGSDTYFVGMNSFANAPNDFVMDISIESFADSLSTFDLSLYEAVLNLSYDVVGSTEKVQIVKDICYGKPSYEEEQYYPGQSYEDDAIKQKFTTAVEGVVGTIFGASTSMTLESFLAAYTNLKGDTFKRTLQYTFSSGPPTNGSLDVLQWMLSYIYETTVDGFDRDPSEVASVLKSDLTSLVVLDRLW
jgi:hypothetical protein